MDSQERHELKENDLAEFLQNFGEWWNKWGNTILIVFVILAGSFAVYRLVNYRAETRHETAWAELAAASTAAGYLDVAASHEDPAVQALAYLRGADLYLAHARRPEEAAPLEPRSEELPPPVDPEMSPADAAERAEQAYARVRELSRQSVLQVNALLGLAAVSETREAWDEAEAYYDEAIELAGEALPGLARMASQRRDLLPTLREPVVFAPEGVGTGLPGMPGPATGEDFDLSELLDDPATPATPATDPATPPAEPGADPATGGEPAPLPMDELLEDADAAEPAEPEAED